VAALHLVPLLSSEAGVSGSSASPPSPQSAGWCRWQLCISFLSSARRLVLVAVLLPVLSSARRLVLVAVLLPVLSSARRLGSVNGSSARLRVSLTLAFKPGVRRTFTPISSGL